MASTICSTSYAESNRSEKPRASFKYHNPCPATGKTKGTCTGYVIDHRIGLCVGGQDIPENMQWMTVEDAKKKDRWECKPGWEIKLEANAQDI